MLVKNIRMMIPKNLLISGIHHLLLIVSNCLTVPYAPIFVSSIPVRTLAFSQRGSAGLSREYKAPLSRFFLNAAAGIDSLNQRDGIHPNEEGAKIVTETVYRSLRPLLEKQGL